MTTWLFLEKSMNAMLRKFSPLRYAFRSEAKRIMQIFKMSKLNMFTVQLHHVQIPQALQNDLSVIHI